MPIETLDEIQLLLDAEPSTFISGGQPRLIRSAEVALGVSLPPTYQAFLSRWGYVSVLDLEYLGLGSSTDYYSDLTYPNVVWYALHLWANGELAGDLLPIRGPVLNTLACLDIPRSLSSGECGISIWDTITRSTAIELDVDFAEFMLDELRECREWLS